MQRFVSFPIIKKGELIRDDSDCRSEAAVQKRTYHTGSASQRL